MDATVCGSAAKKIWLLDPEVGSAAPSVYSPTRVGLPRVLKVTVTFGGVSLTNSQSKVTGLVPA